MNCSGLRRRWGLGVVLICASLHAQTLVLPPRPGDALTGSEFARRITPLDLPKREREIVVQVTSGNVPNFLRRLCPVPATSVTEGKTNTATFYATPDYLAVGSDDDYFLINMSPNTGQQLADALHCSLPTPKHAAAWVDYSQCIRLVQQEMIVNGAPKTVAEVLADPALSDLLSNEGSVPNPRYPTNALPPPGDMAKLSSSTSQAQAGSTNLTSLLDNPEFSERITRFTFEPEVKVLVNAPGQSSFTAGKKVLLVFYALPNGNTTDQTAGKTMRPGDDWHYDIQHIGAQTRFLRDLITDRVVVVVYLEPLSRSWPAWRKAHGDKLIPEIITTVKKLFAGREVETALSGHSGGGSLIFGYLNAVDQIPENVVRIAFLDSNYAYDRALGHRDKLARWLTASVHHYLCVLAYNDAVALLNGKSFVSAEGGTWGRSHAMERDLAEEFKFTTQSNADFQSCSALQGRVQFILKENPEKKIYHTMQVERNGFIHSMVTGTPNEGKGYEYFGPRAYSRWIQPDPPGVDLLGGRNAPGPQAN